MDSGRKTTFGQLLREKRVGLGLTQRALAHAANVDGSYISQLERDYRQPSSRTIESLARALNIDVGELLGMCFTVPPRGREPFVGRERELAAFATLLADRETLLYILGPAGAGKTTLLLERFVPFCREKHISANYAACGRLNSYREFLKEVRDGFGGREAAFRSFDEIYAQCRGLELRLRSRFKDPFSLAIENGTPENAPASEELELSYAEKYLYRDAERLLTEEFVAAWFAPGFRESRGVIFLDDFHALSATVGYWLRRFLERVSEAGLLGDCLAVVIASEQPVVIPANVGGRPEPTILRLEPFGAEEVEHYLNERALKLTAEDRELAAALRGDPRSLKYWADFFEAAGRYADNRLGVAEESLRRLDEDLAADAPAVRAGDLLRMKVRRMLGNLTRLQGRLEEAAAYYGAAVELAAAADGAPSLEQGYLYVDLGHVSRHRGRWDEAAAYYLRAGEAFRTCGEDLGAAIAHSSLGTVYRLKAKFPRAKQEYRLAADILAALADDPARGAEARRWLASTLSNDAIAARLEAERLMAGGEYAGAKKSLARAAALCERALAVGDDAAEGAVAENRLGLCLFTESRWAAARGEQARAAELVAQAVRRYKRALAVFDDLGDKYRAAQVLLDLGRACAAEGLFHDAIINLKNSLALFQQMGSRYHAAQVLVELGLLSEGEEQLSYFAEALASARDHNTESLAAIAAAVKGAFAAADAERARAGAAELVRGDAALAPYFADLTGSS